MPRQSCTFVLKDMSWDECQWASMKYISLAFWKDTLPNHILKPCDGYGRYLHLSNRFFPLITALSLSKVVWQHHERWLGRFHSLSRWFFGNAEATHLFRLYSRRQQQAQHQVVGSHVDPVCGRTPRITFHHSGPVSEAGLGSMRYIFHTG